MTADFVFFWANWLLLGALVLGVVATYAVVVSGNIKEEDLKNELKRKDELIAESNARAEEAKLAAAKANAQAAEAQLELERIKTPRHIPLEQQKAIASAMSKLAILPLSSERQRAAVFSVTTAFNDEILANQIALILGPEGAGWSINRYPVMYGKSYMVSGVGILTSSSPRGIAVADALISELNRSNIAAFRIREHFSDECRDDDPEKEGWCSSISVIVGDKPP